MKKISLSTLTFAFFATLGNATTWNLSAEWSDLTNPFGNWSLHNSPSTVFTNNFENWLGSGNNVWSQSNGDFDHVPAWAKAGSENALGLDVYAGGIVAHTAETERTGTEISFARWTSTITGTVYVRGGTWMARKLDRPQDWHLRKNDVIFSSGDVDPASQYTSANPIDFTTGSGGAGALILNVVPGDTIDLIPQRDPNHGSFTGDFVGMEFCISTSSSAGALHGNIHVQDYEGDVSNLSVPISIRRLDGVLVLRKNVMLEANGDYTLPICINGNFVVSAKPSHWLRQSIVANFNDGGAHVSFDLLNGDVDNDNEITIVDFGILAAAFGSSEGDVHWNPEADLDGDGEVNIVDVSTINLNFGLSGDE